MGRVYTWEQVMVKKANPQGGRYMPVPCLVCWDSGATLTTLWQPPSVKSEFDLTDLKPAKSIHSGDGQYTSESKVTVLIKKTFKDDIDSEQAVLFNTDVFVVFLNEWA
eukprot:TRINITY_DN66907_c11_g1_i1.p2 TRINITY_DN66907_c11_g1~~TRINITY_DN66907_c11_g1_i1.p2  ORF type:complete len:117 (+),score=7.21 TRINITY_DN66907_c11_g1_i1:28-351(+)